MRRFFVAICIISVFFLGGCSKKDQKSKKKKEAYANIIKDEKGLVRNDIIPIYNDDEQMFDFQESDVKDFALIDDEPVAQDGSDHEVAARDGKISPYDEWIDEEDELELAWADKQSDDLGFRVINFDLNKNEIRADQKDAVVKNVQIANQAVKSGKKVVVAGHCCALGSPSFNMSLSEKRAKAIKDEMVKGGIPEEKVKVLGCSSEYPVVLSESQDRTERIKELAPNRRAEISLD